MPSTATSPSNSGPPSPSSKNGTLSAPPQSKHLASPSESTIAISSDEVPEDVPQTESGKLKQLFGILKKTIGVKDLANLRLSLPATFLEPIGNLEYWCYLDRADIFAQIGFEEDELQRMLAVCRFTVSKELKFIEGRLCKPYNSVLSEQFKCLFDVTVPKKSSTTGELEYTDCLRTGPVSDAGDEEDESAKAGGESLIKSLGPAEMSLLKGTAEAGPVKEGKTRVVFLNEQTSHHPPVSNFWLETSEEGKRKVQAYGVDQVGAKFTGTSVKVFPGSQNKGIFVNLPGHEEEYQITHPTANITGFLRGAPNVTVGENAYITRRPSPSSSAPLKGLRAILTYPEEPWIGKAKYLVEGVIYEYDGEKESQYTKVKQVPSNLVRATLSGTWRTRITYRLTGSSDDVVLIDLPKLDVMPKTVRALENQNEWESRRFWNPVSSAIRAKEFGKATKNKQAIEQAQRDKAAQRKEKKEEYKAVLFEMNYEDGRAKLTQEGERQLKKEFAGEGY